MTNDTIQPTEVAGGPTLPQERRVVTALPGPRSQELAARRAASSWDRGPGRAVTTRRSCGRVGPPATSVGWIVSLVMTVPSLCAPRWQPGAASAVLQPPTPQGCTSARTWSGTGWRWQVDGSARPARQDETERDHARRRPGARIP